MMNILLESNKYYINSRDGRVSKSLTNMMSEVRDSLQAIGVHINNQRHLEKHDSFWEHDYAFPIFNE
jgi:hypothetical protein